MKRSKKFRGICRSTWSHFAASSGHSCEIPGLIVPRYWHQGYSIFSKYDDGIWMTDDAWFGVTHESVAKYVASLKLQPLPNQVSTIAKHVGEATNKSIIVDAFCGVGGNTIAFALSGKWKRVYAIEKDATTLACAKHNAEIYGVSDKITWFHGDCFEILGAMESRTEKTVDALKAIVGQFGVIFASPPWGGTSLGHPAACHLTHCSRAFLSQCRDF